MTDIVERLRNHDRHIRGRLIEGLTDLVIDDMVEAADEIERLREMVKWFACHCEGACDRSDQNCLISQAALGEKE